MNFEENQAKVIQWAKDRGIYKHCTPESQLLKTLEELGETSGAYLKGNNHDLRDGLGDVLVTLINFAHMMDLDLVECLEIALKEISGRKGETTDKGFIKDESIGSGGIMLCKEGDTIKIPVEKSVKIKHGVKAL